MARDVRSRIVMERISSGVQGDGIKNAERKPNAATAAAVARVSEEETAVTRSQGVTPTNIRPPRRRNVRA